MQKYRFIGVCDCCPSEQISGDLNRLITLAIVQTSNWNNLALFIAKLKESLPNKRLRKWGGTSLNPKNEKRNKKYRTAFIDSLELNLKNSQVSIFTYSSTEETIIKNESENCANLGIPMVQVVCPDLLPGRTCGNYTKIFSSPDEPKIVKIGPFEHLRDGIVIGKYPVVEMPWKTAVVKMWMLNRFYNFYHEAVTKNNLQESEVFFDLHMDRLPLDQKLTALTSLDFILKAKFQDKITLTYSEKDEDYDLLVDNIAGLVNFYLKNSEDDLSKKLLSVINKYSDNIEIN